MGKYLVPIYYYVDTYAWTYSSIFSRYVVLLGRYINR